MNILRFVYPLIKIKNKIIKPTTLGVRIMLLRGDSILLVKHTYLDSWYLPGGGVKIGETYDVAIKREVHEELGCELNNIKLFGVYNNFFEYKNDSIVIFYTDDFVISGKKDKEIENYRFFPQNKLPENTSRGTKRRIEELLNGSESNFGIW